MPELHLQLVPVDLTCENVTLLLTSVLEVHFLGFTSCELPLLHSRLNSIDSNICADDCSFFMVMIIHRAQRDIARCRRKYGDAWTQYEKEVPYLFIPVGHSTMLALRTRTDSSEVYHLRRLSRMVSMRSVQMTRSSECLVVADDTKKRRGNGGRIAAFQQFCRNGDCGQVGRFAELSP